MCARVGGEVDAEIEKIKRKKKRQKILAQADREKKKRMEKIMNGKIEEKKKIKSLYDAIYRLVCVMCVLC